MGLGDRFHYFRGVSGRRYLFSAVARADLGDFRAAVVIVARPAANGRLAAHWIAMLDAFGRPAGTRVLPNLGANEVVLVHLLSDTDRSRRDLVADLAPPAVAALAA
ncbi:MAG TPA: hypothetical protein VHA70_09170 [Bauldia sp.]|nr:hypothetical protein [Bauldia sp.]